jgi:hypothetical protein
VSCCFVPFPDLHASHQVSHSAIELLLMQPSLLDNLSRAVRGNYGIVLSLLGCLDDGTLSKKIADAVVDSCEEPEFRDSRNL